MRGLRSIWSRLVPRNQDEQAPSETSDAPMTSADLPLILYLDQQRAFDLLATLEGGFSSLRTIETQTSTISSTGKAVDGRIGLNVSPFVEARFGQLRANSSQSARAGLMREEMAHTPASLFARCRSLIASKRLLNSLVGANRFDPDAVRIGEFIEFEATLRRPPFIARLAALSDILPLATAFEEPSTPQPTSQRRSKKRNAAVQPSAQSDALRAQIDLMRTSLESPGSQDLLADVGASAVVLTVVPQCFIDPSMNDVLHGTFRVFGKVTRVVQEGEHISLIRKTSFSHLPAENVETLISGLDDAMAAMEGDTGATGSVIIIEGPTLQVLPIAIFA